MKKVREKWPKIMNLPIDSVPRKSSFLMDESNMDTKGDPNKFLPQNCPN